MGLRPVAIGAPRKTASREHVRTIRRRGLIVSYPRVVQISLTVMHRDEIRDALRRVPFHPFKLQLADGTALDVPHPELLALRQNGRSAFLYGPKRHHHIDMMLVTAIEVSPEPEVDPFGESDESARGERAA